MRSEKRHIDDLTTETRVCLIVLVGFVTFCSSCRPNNKRDEAAKIVNEWMGKQILFPENIPCYVAGKKLLPDFCLEAFQAEFKILMYVDSAGCSNCRLKLPVWKQLVEEADSLFQGKLGFLLYFQPKNVKEVTYLFAQYRFTHPVFIDSNGDINRLNSFPQDMRYQCFLLDKDDKVVAIGNPVQNLKIWNLYKSQIAGERETEPETLTTTATADRPVHDYGTIRKGSTNQAVFTITNTGSNPLVIFRVSTSCGCTHVVWDKQPIQSGQATTIRVEMTPDKAGAFSKTIIVYCNMKASPLRFTIKGKVNE
jgi:hypothetical protein